MTGETKKCTHFTFKKKNGLAGGLQTVPLVRTVGRNIHKRIMVHDSDYTYPFGDDI